MLRIHLIPRRSYTSKADLRQAVGHGFATYGQRLRDEGDKELRLAASSIHSRASLRNCLYAQVLKEPGQRSSRVVTWPQRLTPALACSHSPPYCRTHSR
jgi:hypothetical protein